MNMNLNSQILLIKPYVLLTAALLIGLVLGGCNTTYEMEVDAIKNPAVEKKESYVIVPRDPDTDTSDLRYQETVAWIKTALSGKGMYEAVDPADADMVIEVEYGMEPPRREFKVVEEPVFATVREPDRLQRVSSVDPKTGKVVTYVVRVPGRRSQEVVGYQERVIPIVINEKYLELTAKEHIIANPDGDTQCEEYWSVRVRNEDESDDLREYLPIMAASAADYLGEDTGTEQKVKLKSNDEVVEFIKRGLKRPPPTAAEVRQQDPPEQKEI